MTTNPASVIPEWTMGDRLRKARELTGLTQSQFAARLGVSRGTVSNAESDAVMPRRIVINAWVMASGVSEEWLTTGGMPTPTPPEGGRAPSLDALTAQKRGRTRSTRPGGATARYSTAA